MYDGIKKAVGPGVKKPAPLKSLTGDILTNRNNEMERWAEHCVRLYSRETVVTDTALDGVGRLPVTGELDGRPTVEELSEAIDSLTNGEMGRALSSALLQRNCCHRYSPGWCRKITSHGGARRQTNCRRAQ